MNKEEIYHNYIEDLYPNFMDDNNIEFPIDQKSVELNTVLYKLFFADLDNNLQSKLKNIALKRQDFGNGPFYSFFLNDNEFILSTDYIGPSPWQCRAIAKCTTAEIKKILKQSRTLGGHLMWTRGVGRTPTVNQVKGGELSRRCGYGFYDRIDWTLFLLKMFYYIMNESLPSEEQEKQYKSKIIHCLSTEYECDIEISDNDKKCFKEMYDAFCRSEDWFKVFDSFSGFCDFFKLKGSFVDNDYKVIWFTDCLPIKPTEASYRKYIENNLNAIVQRNFVLENWICSHK